ncbi:unnamed protein product [Adineta ricciae]|uniref:SCP domain-containing protein n=1 Tax=Adineta ricciae TaxID=249248 RepID=A0A814KJJ3_ADIRI|nr:unnamed protein product [Adineta ricciae]CAF1490172.1 unnamed protein product [Adineta ricciae]
MYKALQIFVLCIFVVCMTTADNGEKELSTDIGQQSHNGSFLPPELTNGGLNLKNIFDSFFSYKLLNRQRRASSNFQQEMLNSHNKYRARHCVPALQLDSGLTRSAQSYAEKLARINQMVHSSTPNLGENLYMMRSSVRLGNINGGQATDSWYNEVKQYNYGRPGFSMATGHFTQVVWKSTKRIGVGYAFTNDGKTVYVVAQYSPPGNYQGQFPNNVLQARC